MRILGIDCGTERTGWGVIESDGRRHQVLGHGVIKTKAAHSLEQRLCTIAQGLREILSQHQPQAAAVEGVFYSLNAKTAIKLAHVRGVALLTIAETGLSLGEYSPAEIKSCVVGYGRAEKQQVQMMVRSLTGMRGEFETEDASDAVAVAICHATLSGVKRLAAKVAQ